MVKGFYPAIFDKEIDSSEYFGNYVSTYVERDVHQIINVGDLTNFRRLMILLASRTGQLLNLSSLADDLGVSYKTVDSWISVLEASYVVFRLSPYYENFGKRMIKSPKLYFVDTGLLCFLLTLATGRDLEKYHSRGSVFENFIISEKLKWIYNNRALAKLYFINDNNLNEIDLVVDRGVTKELVEIKLGQTYSPDFRKGLDSWTMDNKYEVKKEIVYTGDWEQMINGVSLLNWKSYLKRK